MLENRRDTKEQSRPKLDAIINIPWLAQVVVKWPAYSFRRVVCALSIWRNRVEIGVLH